MGEYLHPLTEENLNMLVQATFQMNSHADNCAYWLAHNGFVNTEKIFHEKYAHIFPQWADKITDLMIKMQVRPVRKNLESNEINYIDYLVLFEEVYNQLNNYRKKIYDVIEVVEINEDREIVSFLEEFLLELTNYLNQVNIWKNKAEIIEDPVTFDRYFNSFTFI